MKRRARVAIVAVLAAAAGMMVVYFDRAGPVPAAGEGAPSTEEDAPALTFFEHVYPRPAGRRDRWEETELEHRRPGYQDYWFENRNDVPVRLGGVSKSCKCQSIEVYVLPAGYTTPRAAGESPAGAAVGPLGSAALGAGPGPAPVPVAAAESVVVLNPEAADGEATVPPRRLGWVRMKWTGEKSGRQNLAAKLWLSNPKSGPTVTLERRATFVEPVTVTANDFLAGHLRVGDLPVQFAFAVWSATRDEFIITRAAAVRATGGAAAADPFEVGQPVALTAGEREQLRKEFGPARVRCGYRIPVTVRRVAADGKTLIEQGSFSRRVEVATDVSERPIVVTYRGFADGELQVDGLNDAGEVVFGTFRRDEGPSRSVSVRGVRANLKLEVDAARLPEFLRAMLTEEPAAAGPARSWRLDLRVLPVAYGPFPRDDDPVYRDSAVYVRTTGPSPQAVRIAVRGDAIDR
jgi:hypothetical protein